MAKAKTKPEKTGPLIAVPLAEYIELHYQGNNAAFAADFGLWRQNVSKLIKKGTLVIGGVLYRPVAKWATDKEDNKAEDAKAEAA